MTRPIRARIQIAALRHNLAQVRAHAPATKIWAVVKANAYGHGLAAALRGFEQADGLALVEFDLALKLREAGWRKPLLMLEGPFDAGDVSLARQHGLSLAVHEPRQIEWLAADFAGNTAIDVFLKMNSGMNRLGFAPSLCADASDRLAELSAVASVTWMTHFANADQPGGLDAALMRFNDSLPARRVPRSLANSAAIIDHPSTHADWVRPGIMLYGATPFADRSAASLGLRPAMYLETRLIGVQHLATGQAIGYGSAFVTSSPMRVGVVACGYADGYPRHAPTGTPVAVAGIRTRTLGRVSMDMIVVDLEPAPQAAPGDPVELWGGLVPIDEVAAHAGTVGYELMCAVAARVPLVLED